MTKEEKALAIDELVGMLSESPNLYITDSSELSVDVINKFRRLCFQRGLSLHVVKNTLLRKAMERMGESYNPLHEVLHGPTSIIISENGKLPALLLKEFRRSGNAKPTLKAAYIDSAIYIGDQNLDALTNLKSKEELIGEVIGLLQSPMSNVVGALQSGGGTIAGILKALEEKNN